MSEIEGLLQEYARFVNLPWEENLAGPQKVWFAIYDPAQERRLRLRVQEFESATVRAKHGCILEDLTDSFAEWMAKHEYREEYFAQPDDMELALQDYGTYLKDRVTKVLESSEGNDNTVVALLGIGSLFGLTSASALLEAIAPAIRGRLLVFFPGRRDGSNYRLLDARDGWNYLAVPIEAPSRT
ncbi:MAG: DUF1788 domain-containing protein [Anaerolineales bacterium]|nr:DUF1788 domain-containing protein [Anaerolineales bacterium]